MEELHLQTAEYEVGANTNEPAVCLVTCPASITTQSTAGKDAPVPGHRSCPRGFLFPAQQWDCRKPTTSHSVCKIPFRRPFAFTSRCLYMLPRCSNLVWHCQGQFIKGTRSKEFNAPPATLCKVTRNAENEIQEAVILSTYNIASLKYVWKFFQLLPLLPGFGLP